MSISSRSRSVSSEPIDPSPLHLQVYYSTRPGRFPSVDTLPHLSDPCIPLSIPANTTLRAISLLLTPHIPADLLSTPVSDPHPSDIIGSRLSYCLVYPIAPTSSHSRSHAPKYEIKSLGTVTIGEDANGSSPLLDDCGFVTGDLVFVAIVREGESIPPLPAFANERPLYTAPRGGRRGGLEEEQWARGGGFGGRGRGGGRGGRDRDRDWERDGRDGRNLVDRGWRRGEEVPEGGGGRDEWAHGSRGRGGGIGWTRGGRGGGGDRW